MPLTHTYKNLCFALVLLFFSTFSFAQSGIVNGYVKDGKTGNPLPSASVILLSSHDSLQVKGTIVDQNGHYHFEEVKNGDYLVMALFVGYGSQYSERFSIHNETKSLPDLNMKEVSTELSGIEVTSVKDRYEVFADKIVLNVENSVSAADNAFEILRKAPGVTIDQEDNIKLNGAAGVRIQFDGRDINLPWSSIATILKATPTEGIKKIEVISNPSAKYDAEGTAGIVNICFKTAQRHGWSGSVNGWARKGKTWKGGGGINLNNVGKRTTSYVDYNYSQWNTEGSRREEIYKKIHSGDTILHKEATPTSLWRSESHNIRLGGDYTLNPKQVIGASITYGTSKYKNGTTASHTHFYHSANNYSLPDSLFTNRNSVQVGTQTASSNINFVHKFDTNGRQLTLNLDGTYYKNDQRTEVQNDYYSTLSLHSLRLHEHFKQTTPTSSWVGVFRMDYTHPFNETTEMEAGLKNGFIYNDYLFQGEALSNAGLWEADALRNNQFRYAENVLAAYLIFSKKFASKLNVSAGLRTEQTFIKGYQVVTKESVPQRYLNLFPNMQLSYTINPMNILSFSYGYRIDRPDYSQLNPFLFKRSEFQYEKGNPDLKPAFSHNLSVGYVLNYNLFANLDYSYSFGETSQNISYNPQTGHALIYPDNMARSQMLNFSLSTQQTLFSWWTIYLNVGGVYGNNQMNVQGTNVIAEQWAYNFWANSNFILPRKWTIELSGYYQSGYIWGVSKMDGWRGSNIGVKKTFFKDKMDVRLSVSGLLAKETFFEGVEYPNLSIKQWMEHEQFRIGISIAYRFGEPQNRPLQKGESLEEMNRLNGGSNQQTGGQTR